MIIQNVLFPSNVACHGGLWVHESDGYILELIFNWYAAPHGCVITKS